MTKKGAKATGLCTACGLREHCEIMDQFHLGVGCDEWVQDCSHCAHSITLSIKGEEKIYIDPQKCFACARSPLPESGEVNDNFKRRK